MPKLRITLSACALAGVLVCATACAETGAPESAKSGGSDSGSEVAARLGDQVITLEEVDAKAMANSVQAFQALYDARRQALDQIVAERLLAQEAASRGISEDELVDLEVNQKVKAVTDNDVETFFNQNQARMQGQTLEQIGPQIRQYLSSQSVSAARQTFFDGLKKKTALTVSLDPPRVPVTIAAHDPSMGPADAEVTIVEFSDFQ